MLLINPCNIDNCFPLKEIWNVGNWTRGIWVWKKQVCCPPIDFQSLIASFCSHLSKEFELSISWRFSAASFLKVQFKFASSQLFSNLTVSFPSGFYDRKKILWTHSSNFSTFSLLSGLLAFELGIFGVFRTLELRHLLQFKNTWLILKCHQIQMGLL